MQTANLSDTDRKDMNFAMRLSFLVGLLMLAIKTYAFFITGSTAILSDAAESVIHVFAVGFAVYSMWLSFKPADEDHLYGHEKIGFFSAGFEGAMIIIASLYIFYESIYKIIYGIALENLDTGLGFIIAAILINFFLGFYLVRKGKRYKSIILEANGKHILTDCWTSIAVVIALTLVKLTNMPIFDPLVAMCAAANILWAGSKLIKKCVSGLMDQTDPKTHRQIISLLEKETSSRGAEFHHLRHRQSGHRLFIEFHLLFPENIKLFEAHELASEIEAALKASLPIQADIFTHLEPKENHDLIHKKYGLQI